MITLDLFLFGYAVYTVEEDSMTEILNVIRKNDISVRFCKNKFALRLDKIKRFEALIGSRVKLKRSELKGFGGIVYRTAHRYGILLAALVFVVLSVISSDVVWDIRIEGGEEADKAEIYAALSECGLEVGSRWSKIDKSKLEASLLSVSDSLAWVNLNQRGCVAYLKVKENENIMSSEQKKGYANIVAKRDAVIEEITVEKGYAMVSAGDSVKAGDLLISGVIPTELGGGFCYAEGVVKGRISDNIECEAAYEIEEKTVGKGEIESVILNFFKFRINIFKSYRNFSINYDIIESNEENSILGKRMPISISVRYAVPYEIVKRKLTKDETVALASERMSSLVCDRLKDSTLLRIKTAAEFKDRAYVISTNFVCVEDISKEIPFEVSSG